MSSKTFITGFGPFGQVTDNPSAKLAESLERPFQVLEVSYQVVDEFLAGLDLAPYENLLMLGVAVTRHQLCLELFGRNFKSDKKDMRGVGEEGLIDPAAPSLIEATLWSPSVASEIVSEDFNTKMSYDAGEYLCNYISFRALQRFPEKCIGFLHVPPFDKMPFEDQIKSIGRILEIIER